MVKSLKLIGSGPAGLIRTQNGYAPYVAAFHVGLKETGFIDGQNVAIEYRWAEGHWAM